MVPEREDETPIGAPRLPPSTTDRWVGHLGSFWRFLRGLAVVVGVVIGGWLLITDDTGMSCSYSAERKVLTVKVSLVDAEIRRAGDQLVISEVDGPRTSCDDGPPTVRNTDTIRVPFGPTRYLRIALERTAPMKRGRLGKKRVLKSL